jgi:hypothetical protein
MDPVGDGAGSGVEECKPRSAAISSRGPATPVRRGRSIHREGSAHAGSRVLPDELLVERDDPQIEVALDMRSAQRALFGHGTNRLSNTDVHYELATEAVQPLRVTAAFTELASAI